MDRTTFVPKWIGTQHHRNIAVPGGMPSRRVTDLATTAGNVRITSATAAFTAADVGVRVRTVGVAFLPAIAYIGTVVNATTADLRQGASMTGTAITAIIEGESWGVASYYGSVDPSTGIYYYVSLNGGFGGNVNGLFAILPDGKTILLDITPTSPDTKVTLANGRVYVGPLNRPLLSL